MKTYEEIAHAALDAIDRWSGECECTCKSCTQLLESFLDLRVVLYNQPEEDSKEESS